MSGCAMKKDGGEKDCVLGTRWPEEREAESREVVEREGQGGCQKAYQRRRGVAVMRGEGERREREGGVVGAGKRDVQQTTRRRQRQRQRRTAHGCGGRVWLSNSGPIWSTKQKVWRQRDACGERRREGNRARTTKPFFDANWSFGERDQTFVVVVVSLLRYATLRCAMASMSSDGCLSLAGLVIAVRRRPSCFRRKSKLPGWTGPSFPLSPELLLLLLLLLLVSSSFASSALSVHLHFPPRAAASSGASRHIQPACPRACVPAHQRSDLQSSRFATSGVCTSPSPPNCIAHVRKADDICSSRHHNHHHQRRDRPDRKAIDVSRPFCQHTLLAPPPPRRPMAPASPPMAAPVSGDPGPAADGASRFELELEFVSSLANPYYLQYLAGQKYFEDPSFLAYLAYLAYWAQPAYAKYLLYPGPTLRAIELLQQERFRKDILAPETVAMLASQWVRDASSE